MNETCLFQLSVGPCDCVGGKPKVASEPADRRQPHARDKLTAQNLGEKLRANLLEWGDRGLSVDLNHFYAAPALPERRTADEGNSRVRNDNTTVRTMQMAAAHAMRSDTGGYPMTRTQDRGSIAATSWGTEKINASAPRLKAEPAPSRTIRTL
jgi:hypothetical protein